MSTFLLISGVLSHALYIAGISSVLFAIGIAMDIGPFQIFASWTNLSNLSKDPNVNNVISSLFYNNNIFKIIIMNINI